MYQDEKRVLVAVENPGHLSQGKGKLEVFTPNPLEQALLNLPW